MFKSRKFQSSIIKPALYSIFKNPSLMISIMSGDFNKMYCKYWQGKLNSREKFIDLVFNENNDDLINKISILNDYILKTKNSTMNESLLFSTSKTFNSLPAPFIIPMSPPCPPDSA